MSMIPVPACWQTTVTAENKNSNPAEQDSLPAAERISDMIPFRRSVDSIVMNKNYGWGL